MSLFFDGICFCFFLSAGGHLSLLARSPGLSLSLTSPTPSPLPPKKKNGDCARVKEAPQNRKRRSIIFSPALRFGWVGVLLAKCPPLLFLPLAVVRVFDPCWDCSTRDSSEAPLFSSVVRRALS